MCGMSTVWEDTYSCVNQYRCALTIYLINMLSSSYGIIMDCEINETGYGNNVVDGLNATNKRCFREQMELIGTLESNDTPKI